MFIISIVAKVLLVIIATNGFIKGINKDLLIGDTERKRASIAAAITVYLGAIVLFYLAGVFNLPQK